MIDPATLDADTAVGSLRIGDRVRLWGDRHPFTIAKVTRMVKHDPEMGSAVWAGIVFDGVDELTGATRSVWFAPNALVRAECQR